MRNRYPLIPFQISVGSEVIFTDLKIQQINGEFHFNHYRPNSLESLVIPYTLGNSSINYNKLVRYLMIQAVFHCTKLVDFDDELRSIDTTCVLNSYPVQFIDQCRRQFFHEFHPSKLNYVYNQAMYTDFRRQLISTHYPAGI